MHSTSASSRNSDIDIDTDTDSEILRYRANSKEADFIFWLGTRRVTARGKPCRHHLNVVFLRVLPDPLSRLVNHLSRICPAAFREHLEARWPEWFLPDRIIMKRETPDWEEEFNTEVNLYEILAPLRGRVVPKLYGQIEYPGTDGVKRRALIISDIGGIPLGEPEVGSLPLDRVEAMMRDAFQALADARVGHGDPKLDNMHVLGDQIMLIDFDTSYRIEDGDTEVPVDGAVDFSFRMYKNYHERHPRLNPWRPRPQ